jgi:hypothetical protein
MRWAGHISRREDIRNAYAILVRRPEGNDTTRHYTQMGEKY